MRNNDFIANFFANTLPENDCCNHLLKQGNKLFNYSTEIVSIDRLNKKIEFNTHKYSRTTSKIQSEIRRIINEHFPHYEVVEYDGGYCYYWNYGYMGAENWTKADLRKRGLL